MSSWGSKAYYYIIESRNINVVGNGKPRYVLYLTSDKKQVEQLDDFFDKFINYSKNYDELILAGKNDEAYNLPMPEIEIPVKGKIVKSDADVVKSLRQFFKTSSYYTDDYIDSVVVVDLTIKDYNYDSCLVLASVGVGVFVVSVVVFVVVWRKQGIRSEDSGDR